MAGYVRQPGSHRTVFERDENDDLRVPENGDPVVDYDVGTRELASDTRSNLLARPPARNGTSN